MGSLSLRARSQVLLGQVVGAGGVAGQQVGQRGLEERTVVVEVRVLPGGLEIEVLGIGEASGGQLDIAH